jgi:hypothetical protein
MTNNLSAASTSALKMLRSINFFAFLRGALREVGLAGEEKIGLGIYVVLTSRVLSNPLRLCLRESTAGNAKYLVKRVGKLFPPGDVLEISQNWDDTWRRFASAPDRKAVFLAGRCHCPAKDNNTRIEITDNRLVRIRSVEQQGRTIEHNKEIAGSFACISSEEPLAQWNKRGRWLNINLPSPPTTEQTVFEERADLPAWHEVQDLLRERAESRILLPPWEDLVVEKMCENEYAQLHIPAFLQAWKTMSLLRSFLSDGTTARAKYIRADFESYAATGNLLKKVFREGSSFPSPAYIYNRISQVGDRAGVISPVTGKGRTYMHEAEKSVQFQPLLPGWGKLTRHR